MSHGGYDWKFKYEFRKEWAEIQRWAKAHPEVLEIKIGKVKENNNAGSETGTMDNEV